MKQLTKNVQMPHLGRDYMVLLAFVLARHGYLKRATGLIEGLLALGDTGADIRFTQMLLYFLQADYSSALEVLDQLEAESHNAIVPSRQAAQFRTRRYIRARCYCEMGRRPEGEAVARSLSQEPS